MTPPIEIISGTVPPRFKWKQVVDTPVGPRTMEHEGGLPPALEGAIVAIINMVKQLTAENAELRKQIDSHRVAPAPTNKRRG